MSRMEEINKTLPEGFRIGSFALDDEGYPMDTPIAFDVRAHHTQLTEDDAERLGYALIESATFARAERAADLGVPTAVGTAGGGQPNASDLQSHPGVQMKTGFVHPLVHVNVVEQPPGVDPCVDCGRAMDDKYSEPNRCGACGAVETQKGNTE